MLAAIYPDLKDKVVLVTGGGSGIGAAMVRAFVEQGSHVAFLDIQEEVSKALVGELSVKEVGPSPQFITCDLTDPEAIRVAVKQVEDWFGPIKVLVNNAANDERHDAADVTPEYWERCLRRNLNHHFYVSQAVQPQMAASGGGSIINMGSVSWHMAMGIMPGYTTAKAAIEGLTVSLARAYGKQRIRVNCVVPGSVRTERQAKEILTPEYEQFLMERQCLDGHILPEDLAQMILFLGSEVSRYCTRGVYAVDAGIGA
jgi:NAD(P)-dependent dehydrogenase (short-subunit alcohol dehydrogenase family)